MLIEGLSNLELGVVAVKASGFRCALGCFVCPQRPASPTQVVFTKTLLLGIFGGIESTPFVLPLCVEHQQSYAHRMRTISRIQAGLCLAALAFFGILSLTFEHPLLEPYQPIPTTLGILAVVAAYLSIGYRATALPVRFQGISHGRVPFSSQAYGGYLFVFADSESAQRLYEANAPR